MTRKEKLAAKLLDAQIERIYKESCANIQIDVFDILKVFEVGKKAHAEGRDIKEAIMAFVETIRKN